MAPRAGRAALAGRPTILHCPLVTRAPLPAPTKPAGPSRKRQLEDDEEDMDDEVKKRLAALKG